MSQEDPQSAPGPEQNPVAGGHAAPAHSDAGTSAWEAPHQPEAASSAGPDWAAQPQDGGQTWAQGGVGQGATDPWAARPAEVLDGGAVGVVPPAQGNRRKVIAAGTAVAVGVVAVAAGAYAYSVVVGSGDQPEAHLPASTAFVARIDLDPSGGQKIDALRFASKFPTSKDLSWDKDKADKDPRKWLYEQLTKDSDTKVPWSEVSPWLGQKAAFAVTASGDAAPTAVPVVMLQTSDPVKAEASLRKIAGSKGKTGVAAGDGWVVLSDSDAHAKGVVDGAKKSPLSTSAHFAQDLDALGDPGVASFWLDFSALTPLAQAALKQSEGMDPMALGFSLGNLSTLSSLKGHGATALRFNGGDLELVGKFNDLGDGVKPGGPSAKVNLPENTVFALSAAGAGDRITKQWTQVSDQFAKASGSTTQELTKQVEDAFGLKLPDDLKALFGDQFQLAVRLGQDNQPEGGVRVDTSAEGAKKATDALTKMLADLSPEAKASITPDGYVVASSDAVAKDLAAGGSLGTAERFKRAVPEAGSATVVAYVDIHALAKAFPASDKDGQAALEALDSLGLSVAVTGEGALSYTLRLTTR